MICIMIYFDVLILFIITRFTRMIIGESVIGFTVWCIEGVTRFYQTRPDEI